MLSHTCNTSRPKQKAAIFADGIFKYIFLKGGCCILINILLKFTPMFQQHSSIGSDIGLVPPRRQAIIWGNDGLISDAYMSDNECCRRPLPKQSCLRVQHVLGRRRDDCGISAAAAFVDTASQTKGTLHSTHWGRNKIAAISQTFSSAFSWMKIYQFRLIFHSILFPMAKLTIFKHWFR